MCRILLCNINQDSYQKVDTQKLMNCFSDLSEVGNVPFGLKPGYKDGFGFSLLKNNQSTIFATRLFNKNLKELGIENYYSLYSGEDGVGGMYLCSQALPVADISWKVLNNGDVVFMNSLGFELENILN